jgi:hypothetical protein
VSSGARLARMAAGSMAWVSEGVPTDGLDIAIHKIEEKEVAVERQLCFCLIHCGAQHSSGGSHLGILERLGFRDAQANPETDLALSITLSALSLICGPPQLLVYLLPLPKPG